MPRDPKGWLPPRPSLPAPSLGERMSEQQAFVLRMNAACDAQEPSLDDQALWAIEDIINVMNMGDMSRPRALKAIRQVLYALSEELPPPMGYLRDDAP